MHRVATLSLTALLAASTLTAQAPATAGIQYKPSQWVGAGIMQLSSDGNTSSAWSLNYGMGYKKFYVTIAANTSTEPGGDLAGEYQAGFLFMHRQTPGSKGGAVGMGITGGFWDPSAEGAEMSPIVSFNMFGALGKTSRFVGHVMGGLIFPEGGDQLMAFRVGMGFAL